MEQKEKDKEMENRKRMENKEDLSKRDNDEHEEENVGKEGRNIPRTENHKFQTKQIQ